MTRTDLIEILASGQNQLSERDVELAVKYDIRNDRWACTHTMTHPDPSTLQTLLLIQQ